MDLPTLTHLSGPPKALSLISVVGSGTGGRANPSLICGATQGFVIDDFAGGSGTSGRANPSLIFLPDALSLLVLLEALAPIDVPTLAKLTGWAKALSQSILLAVSPPVDVATLTELLGPPKHLMQLNSLSVLSQVIAPAFP